MLSVEAVVVSRYSSDGSAMRYLLPVLWMMSYFHVMEQMTRISDDACISTSSPGGSTSRV